MPVAEPGMGPNSQLTTHNSKLPSVGGGGPWRRAWRQFRANRLALAGLVFVALVYLAGLCAPWVTRYDPRAEDLDAVFQGPSWAHWFGTDDLGRDLWSRVIWGARSAAVVSLSAVSLVGVLGIGLGALAGYARGWLDSLIMRLGDILLAFPSLLLVLFIAATLKPRVVSWLESTGRLGGDLAASGLADYVVVFGALSLVGWPALARLVRAQVRTVGQREFVTAAVALGARDRRVLGLHVLPNALGPAIVALSFGLGTAVLSEAVLSFLGVGVQPPNASWGAMVWESRTLWRTHPQVTLVPGLAVALVALAFNFIGEGLHEALLGE